MKLEKNPVEWSVFGVSAVLVAACIVLLVIGGTRSGDRPPEIAVTTGDAERVAGGFRMPVRMRNRGDVTAEGLQVEIVLESDGKEVERSSLSVAFLPHGSEREGWVVFTSDPRCCQVVARTLAFEKP